TGIMRKITRLVIFPNFFRFATELNEFYHARQILKEDERFRDARLVLISAVKQVLENGLGLLGINAPEEM
ncbi:MAG: DALR anticodon-binding domain-containing protein, partial [Candidatus Woesearchaeota archaeon]|nr:DALR anticodon-binding domain-containing protein [Candidatus Woesearchaeota archaeon]